jgi:hypothetical protein
MKFDWFDRNRHSISNRGDVEIPTETPEPVAFFGFECPRCGDMCAYLRIRGGPADDGGRPTWEWNRDRERPTFNPSINCLAHNPSNPAEKYAGCGWHGWIRDGNATEA